MMKKSTEEDTVFHKIRLSDNCESSKGTIKIIYNGISANSWLTPIGITNRKYVPRATLISENMKIGIKDRAQTATAILGRRHFEIHRQAIRQNEILTGRPLCSRMESSNESNMRYNEFKVNLSPTRMNDIGKRPATSACTFREMQRKRIQSRGASRPMTAAVSDLPDLTVKALFPLASEYDSDSGTANETADEYENDDSNFTNINSMKKEYKKRVESTSLYRSNTNATFRKNLREDANKHHWKMKKAFDDGRKHYTFSEDDQTQSDSGRRSRLKPLMYSQECDIKHSAGCPYQCKGCFRACLASEDYLEKAKKRREGENKRLHRQPRGTPTKQYGRLIQTAIARSQPIHNLIANSSIISSDSDENE